MILKNDFSQENHFPSRSKTIRARVIQLWIFELSLRKVVRTERKTACTLSEKIRLKSIKRKKIYNIM